MSKKRIMSKKSRWALIQSDYFDDEGFWTVDAWEKDSMQGTVIAVIHEKSQDVYYIDKRALWDDYAQQVIKAKIKEIKFRLILSAILSN